MIPCLPACKWNLKPFIWAKGWDICVYFFSKWIESKYKLRTVGALSRDLPLSWCNKKYFFFFLELLSTLSSLCLGETLLHFWVGNLLWMCGSLCRVARHLHSPFFPSSIVSNVLGIQQTQTRVCVLYTYIHVLSIQLAPASRQHCSLMI